MRGTKILRTTFCAMAAAALFSGTVFADTVIVAGQPLSENAASAGTSRTGSNVIIHSTTGPTQEKVLDEKGYLVIGALSDYSALGVGNATGPGPGGSTSQSTAGDTASGQTAPEASAQSPAAQAAQTAAAVSQISIDSSIAKPAVQGTAALIFDAHTGQVLFEKNSDSRLAPASITKLMTALVVMEHTGLDATIRFSDNAVNKLESGAVTALMGVGDTMTVKDAMYALLLRSSCDVAVALAEHVSGSEAAFAELMNAKARQLGCTDTNFANASGLNSDQNYSTARDLAVITRAAFANSTIRDIAATSSYSLPATPSRGKLDITNSNKLLKGGAEYYDGIIAGKTGYTSKAGSCLASEISYGGRELVAVVLKATGTQWSDTKAMFNYAKKLIDASNGVQAQTQSQTAAGAASQTASTASAAAASSSAQSTASASAAEGGKWEQTTGGWKYKKADGTYYTSAWLDLNGNTYFFGSDSIMCVGWRKFSNNSWYYFDPNNGSMVKSKWVISGGKSYYLQSDGTMATSKVIDGQYEVDENGVYVRKVG